MNEDSRGSCVTRPGDDGYDSGGCSLYGGPFSSLFFVRNGVVLKCESASCFFFFSVPARDAGLWQVHAALP